jgi:hypothetical protein
MRASSLLIGLLLLIPLFVFAGVAAGPGNNPSPIVDSPRAPTTPGTEAFTVIFSADSLAPSDDKVQGTLSVRMSPAAMAKVVENRTQQRVADCREGVNDVRCTFLSQADSEARTDVLLVDVFAYQLSVGGSDFRRAKSPLIYERTIRLADLISAVPNRLQVADDLILPVLGSPADFPDDSYSFGIEAVVHGDVSVPGHRYLEFDASPVPGMHINALQTGATPLGTYYTENAAIFSYYRLPRVRWFTYVAGFYLTVLPVVAYATLLWRRGGYSAALSDFSALAILAVTLLLARAILVPPEIRGITRTDYLLFGGVALLIVIAVSALVRELPHGSPRVGTEEASLRRQESSHQETKSGQGRRESGGD